MLRWGLKYIKLQRYYLLWGHLDPHAGCAHVLFVASEAGCDPVALANSYAAATGSKAHRGASLQTVIWQPGWHGVFSVVPTRI